MISLLLTALLCAYSFSATAAEGKTSQGVALTELAAYTYEVDPQTGNNALHICLATAGLMVKKPITADARKGIDAATAKTCVFLFDHGVEPKQANHAGLTPHDISVVHEDSLPNTRKVMGACSGLKALKNVVVQKKAAGLPTDINEKMVRSREDILKAYRS